MSSIVDARRRPNLWSYLSFGTPRRDAGTLPRPSVSGLDSKEDSPRRNLWSTDNSRASSVSPFRDASIMTGGQRSRLVKTGGLLAGLVFLLYFFLFRDGNHASVSGHGPKTAVSDQSKTGASNAAKVEFSEARTAKCTKSFAKDRPLVQYTLMIDAGSTGSRIHVYKFNNCGGTPELEGEIFKMTEKKEGGSGLSAYPNDPQAAAQSLDPLMAEAMKNVPESLKSCTPVAVKATAGLRKLGEEKSASILAAVRSHLETDYPFAVVSAVNGGVEVMDGKDEGVYAWITTNYLLGKIGGPDKTPTAAVFDLGGGSTQIVFEPTFPHSASGGMPQTLEEGDHRYVFKNGGQTHELYQHSHLGYGLMAARESIHKFVVQALYDENPGNTSWVNEPVSNPCIIPGMSREVKVALENGKSFEVTMMGPREASPAQCRGLAEKLLAKEAACKLAPCSFNGVHQPSLSKTFAREDVYIFSYFYDRTQPLGMPESFTVGELRDLTAKVCEGEASGAWKSFEGIKGAMDDLRGRPEGCLDLSFMTALLHTGYEMDLRREVKIAKKINNNELGWCLGASLPLLSQDSGWTCKARQIA